MIKKSLWKGDCFVFDNRVSVKHGLKPGRLKHQIAGKKLTPSKIKETENKNEKKNKKRNKKVLTQKKKKLKKKYT